MCILEFTQMTFRHTRYSVLRTSYQTPILLAIFYTPHPLRGMLQRKRREEWESTAGIQDAAGAGDGSARSLASMNICSEGKISGASQTPHTFPLQFRRRLSQISGSPSLECHQNIYKAIQFTVKRFTHRKHGISKHE